MKEGSNQNSNYPTPNRYRFVALFVGAGFILGLLAGHFVSLNKQPTSQPNVFGRDLRKNNLTKQYPFINPLLACDDLTNVSDAVSIKTHKDIQSFIDEKKNSGDIAYAAVYFRDLNNGPTFGIHETTSFSPGSLLKVPLMMALLKTSETDPAILTRTASFKEYTTAASPLILPTQSLEKNKEYPMEQIMEYMIRYSDNNATLLLNKLVPFKEQYNIYGQLDIQTPNSPGYAISVKKYATFFRILYNATYLSPQNSQKALELLSQIDFKDGLVASLPPNVTLAHKFGEREQDNSDEKQLHDCGIAYAPSRPYLICVMTRGTDIKKMSSVIASISKIVYDGVNSEPPTNSTNTSDDPTLN